MSFHLQKYLNHKQELHFADRLMMIVSVVQPLAAVPQASKIWSEQSSVGVSLWTWLGFAGVGLIFLFYGIMHRLKPFIINQIIWFVVDAVVILGIIKYS